MTSREWLCKIIPQKYCISGSIMSKEGFWFPGQIYEISNGGLIIFNILNLGLKNKISTKNEFSTRQFLFWIDFFELVPADSS